MPDITMCTGVGCTRRKECYRYVAAPNLNWQSYFSMVPVKPDGSCEYFEPVKTRKR